MKSKMVRKILSMVLVSSMMITMLAGCTSKPAQEAAAPAAEEKTDTAKTEEAPAAAETEPEETLEETTIYVPHWDSSVGFCYDLIAGFEAEYPNIKVELIDIAGAEYNNKLNIMLNGGNECDVVWVKDPDITASIAQKGQLEDLTPYIEKDGIDLSLYNGSDALNIDGKQVGMPISTGFYVLYYNKDIFDAANIEYPSNDMTWAEFEELAGKLTSGSGNEKIYGAFLHTWQACVQNWAVQDGKNTILNTDYSFMKPYYEMALRMQEAGTIMDYSTLKTGNIHYSSPFAQGTVAMLPMGSWFIATMIQKVNEGESTVNWGVATLPHPEGMEAGNTVGSTTPIGINSASKNKEAAWKFVSYVCGEKGAQIIANSGEFPAMLNDGIISTIAGIEGAPEGIAEALVTKGVVLDRPMNVFSAEVNQMLGEEHSLIMVGEKSIDEVLEEMGQRSAEIQGK